MAVSSEGNYCGVLWPEQSEYAIYATDSIDSTASWRELARGNAASVAWAASSPTLAVLHVPKVRSRLCSTRRLCWPKFGLSAVPTRRHSKSRNAISPV